MDLIMPAGARPRAARTAVVLWRRLDQPGHDACRFEVGPDGVRLAGCAAFRDGGQVCQLRYSVETDAALITRRALVEGSIGKQAVRLDIRRSARGRWSLNGVPQELACDCVDVDLAFTPATNLLPLRRLKLKTGRQAQAPAAYLALRENRLAVLLQSLRRLSRSEYAYEAPAFGYRDTLKVSPLGVVTHYPGLFSAVACD